MVVLKLPNHPRPLMCNALDTPAFLTMNSTSALVYSIVITVTLLLSPINCNIIRNLLRNNLAGPEINFKDVKFPFDPDAGKRLSVEYQAINGRYGWKAIERLGLGVDGRTDERRTLQQYRDSQGGLSYRVPGFTS